MKTRIAAGILFALPFFLLPDAFAGKKKGGGEDPKEALQNVQEFIGGWKGSGTSEKNKSEIWKETANWSWRFKGKDVFLSVDMPSSKLFKDGELRYLPEKDHFQLTLVDKMGEKAVNTAAGGDRLIYAFWLRPQGRTQFFKQYQIGYTKEGVTFGVESGGKKPECVVTGGLGTSAVTYMGQTYYVCCSGCRDAFNENPAKIIAEWKAKKKSGQ